jgi:hypothetical protein
VYLPRPGDSQKVLAQKKASRARALEALKAGMPPQGLLLMERALSEAAAAANTDKSVEEMSDEELEAITNGR